MKSAHISWERFLFLSIQGGVFLILLTPLLFSNKFFFPTLAPQTLYFRVLVVFLFALYLLLLFESRTYLPRLSPLLLSLGAFLSILALTSFLGIHPAKSFWGTFHRLEGLIAFIHYGLFFLILVGVFKQLKDWILFFRTALFISILAGAIGLLEYFSFTDILTTVDYTRADATLGNPSIYGSYLVFLIFIGILLTFLEQRAVWKIGAWAITTFNGVLLLLSGTRGAWLAVIIGISVSVLLWLLSSRKKAKEIPPRTVFWGFTACLAIFFLFLVALNLHLLPANPFWERYGALWDEGISGEKSRLALWDITIAAWKQAPLFGYGLESFIHVYDTQYDPSYDQALFGRYSEQTEFYDRTHNVFFEFLIAGGIVTLFSYLSVFASTIAILWKKYRSTQSLFPHLLTGLFIAYLVQNMFVFDTTATYLMLSFVLGFTHIYTAIYTAPQSIAPNSSCTTSLITRGILAVSILSLAAFLAAQANHGIFSTHTSLASGRYHLFQEGKPLLAFEQFSNACHFTPLSIRLEACARSIRELTGDPFQHLYSPETEEKREQNLKEAAAELERDLQNHPEMAQVLYYIDLAKVWRNLYLRTQNTEYLAREEYALEQGSKINPLFPQFSLLSEELQKFKAESSR